MANLLCTRAHTAQRAVMTQTGCALALLLVSCFAVAQQTRRPMDAPLQLAMTTSWASHNKYVEVFAGQRHQDYREFDTQGITADGILDTETGDQAHIGIALRWQSAEGWLWHFQAQRQSGTTDYNGYLQNGNGTLSTLLARTGNVQAQASVSVGYALNTANWHVMPENWQLTPLLQLGRYQWQRNLVQYSESYGFNTAAVGALLQWRARPGIVLELQVLTGQTYSASVEVPALGFDAGQPGGNLNEWQIAISQDLGTITGAPALAGWRGTARYTASKYDHGASPTVNGVQAPPNQHQPSAWSVGIQKQY